MVITVDLSSASVCSYSNPEVSFLGIGICRLLADQGGNSNFNPAAQVSQSFGVGLTPQTLTLTSTPLNPVVGGATYAVIATASSGLVPVVTVDVSTSSVCTNLGNIVSFIAAGNCLINVDQPGNATTNSATRLQQVVVVGKGTQVLNFTSTASNAAVGGSTYTPIVTSNAPGVSIVLSVSTPSICSITAGGVVSFIGAGSCDIVADQIGNVDYLAASRTQTVNVARGSQSISFVTSPPGAQVNGPTYTLTATATSGLPVSFSSATLSICTVSNGIVSFVGVGNCTINADQTISTNWNAAPTVQQTFPVFKGVQTVSFTVSAPSTAVVNGVNFMVSATSTAGLVVTFSIDGQACSLFHRYMLKFVSFRYFELGLYACRVRSGQFHRFWHLYGERGSSWKCFVSGSRSSTVIIYCGSCFSDHYPDVHCSNRRGGGWFFVHDHCHCLFRSSSLL